MRTWPSRRCTYGHWCQASLTNKLQSEYKYCPHLKAREEILRGQTRLKVRSKLWFRQDWGDGVRALSWIRRGRDVYRASSIVSDVCHSWCFGADFSRPAVAAPPVPQRFHQLRQLP